MLNVYIAEDTFFVTFFVANYTFHLQELGNCKNWDKLNEGYVKNAAKCMDTFKVQHGAAYTTDAEGLRCSFVRKGNLVVLHRFQSVDHFENFYYSSKLLQVYFIIGILPTTYYMSTPMLI